MKIQAYLKDDTEEFFRKELRNDEDQSKQKLTHTFTLRRLLAELTERRGRDAA
ncbi:hypothetical protein [Leptospira ilyithenensis]|uniref:hypothetical protein n=1 Tax=Leptospira ilyithenensis TaxID=2484901 RepID=UPI001AEFE6B8|nr:hypothetical protein [Leptospira ilyithenensis]